MSDEICHDCPRRSDCLICDSASAIDRCTYHQRAAEAEAAFARMAASRTGQTPRQARERLHQGGIRQ